MEENNTVQSYHEGSCVYRGDGSLGYILQPEGVVRATGQGLSHEYFLKDHLGSTRVVFGSNGAVLQATDYYAFGLEHTPLAISNANRYLYNGKELQDETFAGGVRLGWYDYGARFYDPELGMYHTQDMLAEKYYDWSPYNYVGGNPVKRIDLLGLDWYTAEDGTYQYDPKIKKDSKLEEGQKYVGETYEVKSKDGKVVTSYRKDGSIMFSNEKDAYNRMWNQANDHYNKEKESGGFTLEDGRVLVTPDYDNTKNDCTPDKYGYTVSEDGYLSKGKEKLKITGEVHTHQDPSGEPEPSYYTKNGGWGDIGYSKSMGGLPIFTIGHDGMVHGSFWSNKRSGYDNILGLGSRNNLLAGKTLLVLWLKTYPVKGK